MPLKTLYSLFLCLCSLTIWSQMSNKDELCEQEKKEDSLLAKKMIKEARSANYKKLAEKIMNDIDQSKLPQKNLIIYYNDRVASSPYDLPCPSCCFQYLSMDPNYNGVNFLTPKNMKVLAGKLKKNIVPKNGSSFIVKETADNPNTI